ncbi:MAG: sugar transferase [Ruminococcaceae bacterium]|nr:sugar transferase [Oscillospiraceae bacterium]
MISDKKSKPGTAGYRFVKRTFDILISFIGIFVLIIPMLIIMIAIRIESQGGVLFRQKRVGRKGKEFTIYKFRSMYRSAPPETATGDLINAESHITRVGAFLRKSSLDELPQLFNVLKGDMSLIGPRPLIVSEEKMHNLRNAAGVYTIRPGITGWAQINGRDCVSDEQKAALDTEYLHKISFAMDVRIVFGTIFTVSTRQGYAEGRQSERSSDLGDTDFEIA